MVQVPFLLVAVSSLAAAAGLVLVLLRGDVSDRLWRVALVVGFAVMAAASLVQGSLPLASPPTRIVIALRLGAIMALAICARWWPKASLGVRRFLGASVAGLSISVVLALVLPRALGGGVASSAFVALGSAAAFFALVAASRRSVAARVAVHATGILILVVLLLSLSFSVVTSVLIQQSELARLQGRATAEANLLSTSFDNEITVANVAVVVLAEGGPVTTPAVGRGLAALHQVYPDGGFEWVTPTGSGAAAVQDSVGLTTQTATSLATAPIVAAASCLSHGVGSLELVGGAAFVLGAVPVCTPTLQLIGVVVRTDALDATYLGQQATVVANLSLAIVNQHQVLAAIGRPPSPAVLRTAVWSAGTSTNQVVGGRFLVTQPIASPGGGVSPAVVLSAPTSILAATRDQAGRVILLVAVGAALVAVGLIVVIDDRMTRGLRRLTQAAEGMGRGVRVRAEVTDQDDLGRLWVAFDSMADSIEEQTDSIRSAADMESRLRARLESVVAGMSDALVAIDTGGRITDFNRAAEEMMGCDAAHAVGRPVGQVVRLVNDDGASLGRRLATSSPARWAAMATVVDGHGTEFRVAVSSGPLRGASRDLEGHVLLLRDLRHESEMERIKAEYFSRMGHELRTPLTAIVSSADLLLRHSLSAEDAGRFHSVILDSANRLSRVVEMLEFFAARGAGWVLFRPAPLDVRDLLDPLLSRWSKKLTGKGAITVDIDDAVTTINGDRRWLGVAIDELIDNAVKFSPPGAADVSVTVSVGHALEISVRDRGKGMTAREQATAFEEFVQGDGSDNRQFGGLGLGLSLVQRVVEGHGGSVTCQSMPSRGSTLTIVLPLQDAGAVHMATADS